MLDLQTLPAELGDICRFRHIERLSIFGSAVRGELRADSDVDLLVEFEHGHAASYFELVELSDQLSPLFGGRTVDLVTPHALHRLIRAAVLSETRVIFEAIN